MTSLAEPFTPFTYITSCDTLRRFQYLRIPTWKKCFKQNVSDLIKLAFRAFWGADTTGSTNSPGWKGLKALRACTDHAGSGGRFLYVFFVGGGGGGGAPKYKTQAMTESISAKEEILRICVKFF